MLSSLKRSARLAVPLLATAFGFGLALPGCGGDSDPPPSPHAAQVQAAAASGVAQGFVGAAAGIVTPRHIDTAVAGFARIDTHVPVTSATMFSIGSNTKAMTAYVAARLVDRGAIRWDSRVAEVLPELQATLLPVYANITLEQLLAHKGGLRAYTADDDLATFAAYLGTVNTPLPDNETARRHFFVQFVLTQAPPAGVVPGATFSYSNAGYVLAAAMLEKATGQGYETLFDTELARPLGITGTWGARPTSPARASPTAITARPATSSSPRPMRPTPRPGSP